MSDLLQRLIEQAKALSPEEKTLLADEMLRETAAVSQEWEAAWAADCERRLNAIDAGATETIAWDDVKQRLFGR